MTRLGGHRARVTQAIDELEATASTNLGAGVRTRLRHRGRGSAPGATNRVVLLSADGLANTGDTDADTILERIADARREHGITLFGWVWAAKYGDVLMERLADRGDGPHDLMSSSDGDARQGLQRDSCRRTSS